MGDPEAVGIHILGASARATGTRRAQPLVPQSYTGNEPTLPELDVTPDDKGPAARYLRSLAPGSRPTIESALNTIAKHLEYPDCRRCPWWELTPDDTEDVRNALADHYEPATARKMLVALRRVLRQCRTMHLIDEDRYTDLINWAPVRGNSEMAGRHLSRDEVARILSACLRDPKASGARDAALFSLLTMTGLRRREAAGLDLADYQRADPRGLRVLGKGRKRRTVAVNDAAAAVLNAWLQRRGEEPGPLFCRCGHQVDGPQLPLARLSTNAILDALNRRAARAGVAHLTPHDFRRTLATDLFTRGVDIVLISKILGHSSIETTKRYDRRADDAQRQALLGLPGFD